MAAPPPPEWLDVSRFRPQTTRGIRRVTRGDFGRAPAPSSEYPRQGTFVVLDDLLRHLDSVPYCGSGAAPPNAAAVPPALRAAADAVPPAQQCLVAARYYANEALQGQRAQDRRTLRGPRVGQPVPAAFAALPRLDQAKVHLDRARQMYVSGRSNLARGLERRNAYTLNRGRGMQYSVEPGQPQRPRVGRKSALYELYRAYALVREYEMDPTAPLDDRGEPNGRRIDEDLTYEFLMGTRRMQPNRLGIGDEARAIWRQHQVADPNYYGAGAAPDPYARLYAEVASGAARGPERVQALFDFLDDTYRRGEPAPPLPPSDALDAEFGYPNRTVATDMAHALENIHANFPPPRSVPRDVDETRRALSERLEAVPGAPVRGAVEGPPPMRWPPHALLGDPYPPGAWPYGPEIRLDPATYVPVYFPTGRSYRALGTPAAQWDGQPTPPYVQIAPLPEHGVPSSDEMAWDGRVAAELLASHTGRLTQQALAQARYRRALAWQALAQESPPPGPPPPPPLLPLRYWRDGLLVPAVPPAAGTQMRLPSRMFEDRERARLFLDQAPAAQRRDLAAQPRPTPDEQAEGALDLAAAAARGPMRTRVFGVDGHVFGDAAASNLVDDLASRLRFGTSAFYPHGVPAPLTPAPVDPAALLPTEDRDAQVRMLQHALFLLAAPQNDWQRRFLPPRLWLSMPPVGSRDPGSATFGDNAPGEGFIGRGNDSLPDASLAGWHAYLNPFRVPPTGGVRGRRDVGDLPTTAAAGFRSGGVAIGPFRLDPEFGRPGHVPAVRTPPYGPGPRWRLLWVWRTNQLSVLGTNTYGLDWYGLTAANDDEEP